MAAKCIGGKPGTMEPTKGVTSRQGFEILAGADEGLQGVVVVFESKADLVDAQEFFRGVNSVQMPFPVSDEWRGLMPVSYVGRNPPFLIQMPSAGERHLLKIHALFDEDHE